MPILSITVHPVQPEIVAETEVEVAEMEENSILLEDRILFHRLTLAKIHFWIRNPDSPIRNPVDLPIRKLRHLERMSMTVRIPVWNRKITIMDYYMKLLQSTKLRHLLLRINLWPGRCPRWPPTTSQSYPCPPLMATPTWATRTGSTTPGRPPTSTTSARPRTSKGSRRGWCRPTPFQPKKRKKKAKSHSSKLSSPQSCDLIFWQIYFYLSCLSPNFSRENNPKTIPNSELLW